MPRDDSLPGAKWASKNITVDKHSQPSPALVLAPRTHTDHGCSSSTQNSLLRCLGADDSSTSWQRRHRKWPLTSWGVKGTKNNVVGKKTERWDEGGRRWWDEMLGFIRSLSVSSGAVAAHTHTHTEHLPSNSKEVHMYQTRQHCSTSSSLLCLVLLIWTFHAHKHKQLGRCWGGFGFFKCRC